MKFTNLIVMTIAVLALLVVPMSMTAQPAAAEDPFGKPYECFPTCSTVDSRMLSLAGSPLITLANEIVNVKFTAPADATSFEIGIFDGDTGKDGTDVPNPAGGHWDQGTDEVLFTLYADPAGDRTGTVIIGQWLSNGVNPTSDPLWTASSPTMPDDGWWDVTVQTSGAAQATPGSPYVYNLRVELPNAGGDTSSNFKLRTTGSLRIRAGATMAIQPAVRQAFREGTIIYPSWDGVTIPPSGSDFWLTTPTTYDGTWTLRFDVPVAANEFQIFDGDFDFGSGRLTGHPSGVAIQDCKDGDDPDSSGVPYFVVDITALPEGAQGTGVPEEDSGWDFFRRSPCVRYEVADPLANIYPNENPSGNREWEQFRITTDPAATRNDADYGPGFVGDDGQTSVTTTPLPAGEWQMKIYGLDLDNIGYLRFSHDLIGVPSASIGDRVWYDINGDGLQDAGEPGFGDVVVNLYHDDGDGVPELGPGGQDTLVGTQLTTIAGSYDFLVGGGNYWVEVDTSTLPPGSWTPITFAPQFPSFGGPHPLGESEDYNDADFGYNLSGASGMFIGDYVWLDANGDGVQDGGESGLEGVTLRLDAVPDDPQIENFTLTTATDPFGVYVFTGLVPGSYTVTVEASNFDCPNGPLCGLVPTTPFQTVEWEDSNSSPAATTLPRAPHPQDPNQVENEDFNIDFGYRIEAACGLEVVKTCQAAPPPPSSFSCSDAKPIDELTMIWDGSQEDIRVKAWKGNVGSILLTDIDGVSQGDEVNVSGFAGSPNDVYWEIFEAGTDNKIGESVFHLSCSDDDMNGPEDCGKREGDGKGQSDRINDWLFEGMAGNGLTLDCTPTPPTPSDTCEIVTQPAPSCETLGKPASLTFKYMGGSCAESDHDQGDEAKCSGDPSGAEPVRVVYTGKDSDKITVSPSDESIYEEGEVTIEATGRDRLHSNTKLEIWQGGTLLQSLQIHTSCSQPLEVGDVFGSLELVAINGQREGSEVTYSYEVTNNGSALTGVTLVDNPLGPIAGPFDLGEGATLTVEKVARILETTINIGTVSGELPNGQMCEASDTATVTVRPACEVNAAYELEFHNKEIRWDITNSGQTDVTISRILITWPAENGYLNEIKRDGDKIHDGDFDPTSAVIDSGWEGNADKRTIEVGKTDTLKFKFQNDAHTNPGDYLIQVEFDEGCAVRYPYTAACLVIIDEDTIDNDISTIEQAADSHDVGPDELINDDDPTENGNPWLLWNTDFAGDVVLLPGGEVDDEGWFALPENPVGKKGPFSLYDFAAGTVPQNKLDEVGDVMPLRNQDLYRLVGRTCVAVVYDSDISMNYGPIEANLQGERYGRFAFTVLGVELPGTLPESGSDTSLYDLRLRVEPPMDFTERFDVTVRDHEPDAIEITEAEYDGGVLRVYGTSDFDPDAYMTVSVDDFVLEAAMTYNDSEERYEYVVSTGTDLLDRRVMISTDEGGAYNDFIE